MDEPVCWVAKPVESRSIPFSESFPTISVRAESGGRWDVDEETWNGSEFDFWAFDRSLDERAGERFHVSVRTADPEAILSQVLTRCQRLIRRRNDGSSTELFERILTAHESLHDRTLPLVQADLDHALDVWQWVLRLESNAPLAVQIAALYHDVERLGKESVARVEHAAPDYPRFKAEHARAGAAIADASLRPLGIDEATLRRAVELIASHESPGDDPDRLLINEADALSFFSLNSPGFFDYFDSAHCRRKVRYTLDRMRDRSLALLPSIRLREDVAAAVRDAGGPTS